MCPIIRLAFKMDGGFEYVNLYSCTLISLNDLGLDSIVSSVFFLHISTWCKNKNECQNEGNNKKEHCAGLMSNAIMLYITNCSMTLQDSPLGLIEINKKNFFCKFHSIFNSRLLKCWTDHELLCKKPLSRLSRCVEENMSVLLHWKCQMSTNKQTNKKITKL